MTGSYLEQCKRLVEASGCKSNVSRSVVCIMTATLDDVWSFSLRTSGLRIDLQLVGLVYYELLMS